MKIPIQVILQKLGIDDLRDIDTDEKMQDFLKKLDEILPDEEE
jgi:hypothetical protein